MKKVMYVAPEFEILEVMVEAGFQSSVTPDTDFSGSPSPF